MRLNEPVSFKAYGLTFESEIFLPGLAVGGGDADVVIRVGTVDPGDSQPAEFDCWVETKPDEIRLFWDGVGRFLIRDASEVIVQPAADIDPQLFQQTVLGPIFCLVAQQRGWYPLHASAVLAGDSVVALAGASGRGKSSLAAALSSKGYSLVADDVTVIDTAASPPQVRPGITALKLWPDALARLGKPSDSFPTVDDRTEKRRLDPHAHELEIGAGLRSVYLLDEGTEPSISPVPPEEALLQLVDLCQYRDLLHGIAGTVGLMPHAARIAHEVPVFRFTRKDSLSELFETAAMLEEHLSSRSVLMHRDSGEARAPDVKKRTPSS